MEMQIQVVVLLLLMVFGITSLWITFKDLQKEMAGFLTPPKILSTHQLYHNGPFQSMVEKIRAKPEIGNYVFTSDEFLGCYVGEVAGEENTVTKKVPVRILACMAYPKQHAALRGNWDVKYERIPLSFNQVKEVHTSSIGSIPVIKNNRL